MEKNRISYNFMTGEDYEKRQEREHVYINRSEGVLDMFNAFQEAKATKPKHHQTGKKNQF
jgi:hypothetical protein